MLFYSVIHPKALVSLSPLLCSCPLLNQGTCCHVMVPQHCLVPPQLRILPGMSGGSPGALGLQGARQLDGRRETPVCFSSLRVKATALCCWVLQRRGASGYEESVDRQASLVLQ